MKIYYHCLLVSFVIFLANGCLPQLPACTTEILKNEDLQLVTWETNSIELYTTKNRHYISKADSISIKKTGDLTQDVYLRSDSLKILLHTSLKCVDNSNYIIIDGIVTLPGDSIIDLHENGLTSFDDSKFTINTHY